MKGINAIKKARNIILNDMLQWLLDKGLTKPDAEFILSGLPLIFAVKNNSRNIPVWCFLIEEENRRFDSVLAVSVDAGFAGIIDGFFLLPTQDFTSTNFLILRQNDELYNSSKIETGNVGELIKHFFSTL